LLGGNTLGDFKLKPMLIYHSMTPQAIKGYSKGHLHVIWKSNKKAWLTRDIFQQWFIYSFCPAVQRYCEENDLEPRAFWYSTMPLATLRIWTAYDLYFLHKWCSFHQT
jgi:hypothetical protein